jgi:hypothetical protein
MFSAATASAPVSSIYTAPATTTLPVAPAAAEASPAVEIAEIPEAAEEPAPKAAPAAADDDNDEFDLEYSRQIAARRVIGEEDGEA